MNRARAIDVLALPPAGERSPYAAGRTAIAHADGGSRGNPGPAAYGCAYLDEEGEVLGVEGGAAGETTNNVAEYQGCIRALERLRGWKVRHVVLRLDSELVVRQLEGRYRVRQEHLKPLHERARRLCAGFESCRVEHVRREENRIADAVANAVLDGRL